MTKGFTVVPTLLRDRLSGVMADAHAPAVVPPVHDQQSRPGDRRMARLRRTVLLGLAALVMGTMVARSAQDPAVALPRIADGAQAVPGATPGADAAAPGTGSTAADGSATDDQAGAGGQPATGEDPPSAAPPAQAPNAAGPGNAAPSAPASPGSAGEIEEGASDPSTAPGVQAEPVQQAGLGTVHAVDLRTGQPAVGGRSVRYAIEVEDGVSIREQEYADTVQTVLADARGWQTQDGISFLPVTPAEVAAGASLDIRITLATPSLTARLCAPLNTTISQVSCWNGHRAVLNLQRWVRGATTFGTDLTSYRTYLINHEVGHGLGHRHQQCPASGQPAPIMVQQTKSLEGCTPWPWPTRP